MRVLVVEDHELLARTIGAGLRRAGMAVDVVTDGGEALARLDLAPYDVLVLDRDLPTISGDDVCRQVGERSLPARVLMLTAAGTLADPANPFTTTVKTTLGRLRAKLGEPPVITTVRESGYRAGD